MDGWILFHNSVESGNEPLSLNFGRSQLAVVASFNLAASTVSSIISKVGKMLCKKS